MCFQTETSCARRAAVRARQRSHHQLIESMAATEKVQQELEQVERQVAEMESAGPIDAMRRQIAVLQERIETLRREMNAPPTAWQKTELARHPQRPQIAGLYRARFHRLQ